MHRVLATLEHRRYVENNPDRQEWFIGPEAFRLGSAFLRRTNIVERSRGVMRDLMALTGETANLGIERDGDVGGIFLLQQAQKHRDEPMNGIGVLTLGSDETVHRQGIKSAKCQRMAVDDHQGRLGTHAL